MIGGRARQPRGERVRPQKPDKKKRDAQLRPNLFRYATSELSQDAFICWLLESADQKYRRTCPELHAVGQEFVGMIFARHTASPPSPCIQTVEIFRQEGRIDILAWVNQDIAIVIEDKVGTKQSRTQLGRYREHAETQLGRPVSHILFVYIQSGDQSDYSPVHLDGYAVFNRSDLLALFEGRIGTDARATNQILDDFAIRLRQIEDQVQSYAVKPVEKWGARARIGFVSRLKSELGVGQWDYVNNKAGGFYGYFGKRIRLDDGAMYLQVEMSARENKLCIKIDVKDDDRTKHFGHRWSKRCVADSRKQGLFVLKPGRIRVGQTMTVAKNEKPFPVTDEHGYVDITATVELLRSWQSFIELYARVDDAPLPPLDAIVEGVAANVSL